MNLQFVRRNAEDKSKVTLKLAFSSQRRASQLNADDRSDMAKISTVQYIYITR